MKLKIDHFYIAVDEQTFKSHLENPELMKFCNHKVVVADGGDESWEGLYFLTQGEIYFELVKEVPKMNILKGTVGVAISQIAAEEERAQLQKTVDSFSSIKWSSHDRTREDGTPWFRAWYPEDNEEGFYFWLMAYSKEESEKRQSLEHSGVKEFKKAEFNLDISKHKRAFEVLGSILNLEEDKNGITFSGENQSFKLKLSNEYKNNDLTIVDTNDQTIKLRLK